MNKILIANRGEIASRVMRTAEDLGYNTVAVYSVADAELPFVSEAHEAVCIGGPSAADSYLSMSKVLEAAARTGADAIHPGFGFLSENAEFAEAVQNAGLTWVGPSPEAIRAMGDKARARQLAAELGVPTVPGFDASQDPAELAAAAERIGFPVLIKAVAGGGGRGMRRVNAANEFAAALASAKREALSSFGDEGVIVERLVERPRHIEVQVFGDASGQVVHLFERECSIQRRHQKVVEEAPSPALTPELREEMGAAAVRVASSVAYVGAGTVEFLLGADGSFYFLEMNTRLQVEHPVTECITDLDLVAMQFAVAEGELLALDGLAIDGHAVEVRVYAEDPNRDYMAATGVVERFAVPQLEGTRIEAGVQDGSVVSPHYDAMLAKLIAWGPTRAVAVRRLRRLVEQTWIPGIVTNLPLLREILAHPAFEAGEMSTSFLSDHSLPSVPPTNLERGAVLATALAAAMRPAKPFRVGVPAVQRDTWAFGAESVECSWIAAAQGWTVSGGESTHEVVVHELGEGAFVVELDGHRQRVRFVILGSEGPPSDGDRVALHWGAGEAFVTLTPRFPPPAAAEAEPGSCVSPTPGTVTAVHVAQGDAVKAGQSLVTVEAMKMEHAVTAPHEGIVSMLRVEVGAAVEQGDVLVRLEVP